jgi:hypothetical protein
MQSKIIGGSGKLELCSRSRLSSSSSSGQTSKRTGHTEYPTVRTFRLLCPPATRMSWFQLGLVRSAKVRLWVKFSLGLLCNGKSWCVNRPFTPEPQPRGLSTSRASIHRLGTFWSCVGTPASRARRSFTKTEPKLFMSRLSSIKHGYRKTNKVYLLGSTFTFCWFSFVCSRCFSVVFLVCERGKGLGHLSMCQDLCATDLEKYDLTWLYIVQKQTFAPAGWIRASSEEAPVDCLDFSPLLFSGHLHHPSCTMVMIPHWKVYESTYSVGSFITSILEAWPPGKCQICGECLSLANVCSGCRAPGDV